MEEIEFSQEISDKEEGMALMAGFTLKMIDEMIKRDISSEAVIANICLYLKDFYEVCPEIVQEYFNDHLQKE